MASKKIKLPPLQEYLPLAQFFSERLGFRSPMEVRAALQMLQGTVDSAGHTDYYAVLRSMVPNEFDPEALQRYDRAIVRDVQQIGKARGGRLRLTYPQYLAVLWSAYYLDRYTNVRAELIQQLNKSVAGFNRRLPGSWPRVPEYLPSDLAKLVFWMATGSGKTLLMHLQMMQVQRYRLVPHLGQLLLITPDESLTQQHLEELRLSGLTAYHLNSVPPRTLSDEIQIGVIEIAKLSNVPLRGGGVSIPLERLGDRNIVFVDEGHKGNRSEEQAWKERREALARNGFMFEYSATFGQAVNGAENLELLQEYGRSIVLDYSYRFFHDDGYGKEFDILNIDASAYQEYGAETVLMGSLLAFYQQCRAYQEHADTLRPYAIERPLAIFVGASVKAVERKQGKARSDVLRVVDILARTLENRDRWAETQIHRILYGDLSRLTGFLDRFAELRAERRSAQDILTDLSKHLFGVGEPQVLRLEALKRAPGEIGLRAGTGAAPFGVIYVGDAPEFLKLAETHGLTVAPNKMDDSLFRGVNRPDSSITMVIGARKFNEGWNSWRVSCMGLLNIGKSEGSSIIQLFGRGVRLKGLHGSLKRSTALAGSHPLGLQTLETLTIFSLDAEYLSSFQEHLRREGVPIPETVMIPTQLTLDATELVAKRLMLPRIRRDVQFERDSVQVLAADTTLAVSIDLRLHVQRVASTQDQTADSAGMQLQFPAAWLQRIDWASVVRAVRAFARTQEIRGLLIPPDVIRVLFETGCCTVLADDVLFADANLTLEQVQVVQSVAEDLARQYVDKYYREQRTSWERKHIEYRPLLLEEAVATPAGSKQIREANFIEGYTITVAQTATNLADELRSLVKYNEHIQPGMHPIRRLTPNVHLYKPLLTKSTNIYQVSPVGMDDDEADFVRRLDDYVREPRHEDHVLDGAEVYLLRNYPRIGVGFFSPGFFPDFILWVLKAQEQWVIFVDPKGLLALDGQMNAQEVRLAAYLKEIEKQLSVSEIHLDSFLISNTSQSEVFRRWGNTNPAQYEQAHILFQEDENHIPRLFQLALT